MPKLLIWLPLLLSVIKCFVRIPAYHRASVFFVDFPMFHNMPNGSVYIPFYGLFQVKSLECNRQAYTPGQEGVGPSAKHTPFKVPMRDVGAVIVDLTFEVTPYHTGKLFKFKGDTPDGEFKKKLEERFVDRVNSAASLYVNSKKDGDKDGDFAFKSIDEIIGTQARASDEIMLLAKGLIEAAGGILNTVIVKDLENANSAVRDAAQALAARQASEEEERVNIENQMKLMGLVVDGVKDIFGQDAKPTLGEVTDILDTQTDQLRRIQLSGSGAKGVLPLLPLGKDDDRPKKGKKRRD